MDAIPEPRTGGPRFALAPTPSRSHERARKTRKGGGARAKSASSQWGHVFEFLMPFTASNPSARQTQHGTEDPGKTTNSLDNVPAGGANRLGRYKPASWSPPVSSNGCRSGYSSGPHYDGLWQNAISACRSMFELRYSWLNSKAASAPWLRTASTMASSSAFVP